MRRNVRPYQAAGPTLNEAGQAAVESALVLPLTMFILLGLLQMGMMQQARLFADYAAFRGARAASLEMNKCTAISRAEIAALVPSYGRADSDVEWGKTFNRMKNQVAGGQFPVVLSFWNTTGQPASPTGSNIRVSDEPATNDDEVVRVHLRMYYMYELRIPFVNWILAQMFLAQYYAAYKFTGSDVIHNTSDSENPNFRGPPANAEAQDVFFWDKVAFNNGRYVVPLYASWSMRMFSRSSAAARSNPNKGCRGLSSEDQ